MIGLRLVTWPISGLLGLAAGLLVSTPAFADTVKLICGDENLYVRIDMDSSTAGSTASAETIPQIQMYPATITDDQVTWTVLDRGWHGTMNLDRHSGVLTYYWPGNGQINQLGTCKKDNQDILSN